MQAAPRPGREVDRRWLALQFTASAAILGVLWWQADPVAVLSALRVTDLRWLLVACGIEVGVLTLRAWRVARAVGVEVGKGTQAAMGANVLNLLAPARAADLVAAALVARVTGAGLVVAIAAYGAVVIADMFVHASWLLVALGLAGGMVDEVRRVQSISVVGAGLLALGIAVAFARRLTGRKQAQGRVGEGIQEGLRRLTLAQVGLGAVQLSLVIAVFRANLEAVGALDDHRWLAAALCQALGAIGSFLMPAAMGAGPATAATVILPLFGASPAQGVAFGALLWFTAAIPDVFVGLPMLWRTRAT